jgi:hypothetical protein
MALPIAIDEIAATATPVLRASLTGVSNRAVGGFNLDGLADEFELEFPDE